jgi:hypothetical protein
MIAIFKVINFDKALLDQVFKAIVNLAKAYP